MTTLRCRPPVQPTPIDRYALPSRSYAGQRQRRAARRARRGTPRVGLRQHVVADRRVEPGQRPQLVDPVRVRQEAAVEHEVDVEREAVLVAERHDVDLQRAVGGVLGEELAQPVAQLVHVEVATCRR